MSIPDRLARRSIMTTQLTALLVTLAAACSTTKEPAMTTTPKSPTVAKQTGHAELNGVNYYYEIRGEGAPLLVLHGGLGSIDMFEPILPALGKDRKIIAVDLHGHGRTQLGKRAEISLVDQGNDMAALLDKLGVAQADVLGYSFGAGVALRLGVQHPEKVKRLALVSIGFASDGFYPEMVPQQGAVGAQLFEMMKETPMYKSYAAVAPDKSEFPKLLDAMGALMRKPYNYADDAKKLSVPTILIFGDSDMFRLEHIVEFYKLLGGGQKDAGWQREHIAKNRLAILPDVTHYDMFMQPAMVTTARAFLDGKSGAASWAAQVAK
jgi:pimeloyl-ACP methyl ester carboxylesterase